jgi:putative component of toxin-antitoxin plasmid stabilization module
MEIKKTDQFLAWESRLDDIRAMAHGGTKKTQSEDIALAKELARGF